MKDCCCNCNWFEVSIFNIEYGICTNPDHIGPVLAYYNTCDHNTQIVKEDDNDD